MARPAEYAPARRGVTVRRFSRSTGHCGLTISFLFRHSEEPEPPAGSDEFLWFADAGSTKVSGGDLRERIASRWRGRPRQGYRRRPFACQAAGTAAWQPVSGRLHDVCVIILIRSVSASRRRRPEGNSAPSPLAERSGKLCWGMNGASTSP